MPEGSASAPEIIHVKTATVSCDGGNGAYGHPLVYLRIKPEIGEHEIMCPYCSRRFILDADAAPESH